jgi:proline iminopeptidase
MLKAAWKWSQWEEKIVRFRSIAPPPAGEDVVDEKVALKTLPIARLENHYSMNNLFLPYDHYLIDPKRLYYIQHIPTVIVQGRYDMCTPPTSAFELHRILPKTELIYTLSGHSAKEEEIVHHLVSSTDKFKNRKF